MSDLVQESKHSYVASECVGCEVVLEESVLWSYVEVVEEAKVEVVQRFKRSCCSMVYRACRRLDHGEYVRFVLVDECGDGVEGAGAEECLEFGARFGEGFGDGVVHCEFGVEKGSEEAKGGSVAVAGVYDAKLFFKRIEFNSVSSSPCMN